MQKLTQRLAAGIAFQPAPMVNAAPKPPKSWTLYTL